MSAPTYQKDIHRPQASDEHRHYAKQGGCGADIVPVPALEQHTETTRRSESKYSNMIGPEHCPQIAPQVNPHVLPVSALCCSSSKPSLSTQQERAPCPHCPLPSPSPYCALFWSIALISIQHTLHFLAFLWCVGPHRNVSQ